MAESAKSPLVVAVTGGAKGIGLATARRLVQTGARVAIGDVDEAALADAAAEFGNRVLVHHLDVSDTLSFQEFVAAAEQQWGPLDVLVNNAGIMPIGPFLDETAECAQAQLDVNVMGCLNGMKAALPGMIGRGHGHVLNVASVAGKGPVPGGLTYAATKAAVISATETARVEFSGTGVSFTCVLPSFTRTDLVAGTQGLRGVATLEADDVAAAIVGAIDRPRADVYLPSILRFMRFQVLLPRPIRDASNRLVGGHRAFLDVDRTARLAYDRSVAAVVSRPRPRFPAS